MYFAHIIHASFSQSVQEASAATTSSSSVRRPRRAFRRRADIPHRLVFNEDTEMPDVGKEVEAATLPSNKRTHCVSPSPPPKRARLSLPSTTRDASATALWCASACDQVSDLEKNRILFLISALVAHVSVSGFGQSLSLWFEEKVPSQTQTIEVRLLCLGAVPGGRSSCEKRPLEENSVL